MMKYIYLFLFLGASFSCGKEDRMIGLASPPDQVLGMELENFAMVTGVTVTGQEDAYTFSVGIQSPDTGCTQYANWWEVITLDGELRYRRILAHSHVNEQPFVRSGGPVEISVDQEVYVRAHMNTSGYGTQVYRGSVQNGFVSDTVATTFAESLATQPPLPNGCAF